MLKHSVKQKCFTSRCQGISDLITAPGYVNLDFADVRTVMADQGTALMGIGASTGENRTAEATKKAISSPLLEVSIDGAEQILLNIKGGDDLTLFEAQDAADIVAAASSSEVNIIFGTTIAEDLEDEVIVTVIATGIDTEKRRDEKRAKRSGGHSAFQQSSGRDFANQPDNFKEKQVTERRQEENRDIFNDFDSSRYEDSNHSRRTFDDAPSAPVENDYSSHNSDDDELDTPPFFRKRRR